MRDKASNQAVFEMNAALPPQHVNLEVDAGRHREYGRWIMVGAVLLGALLFNVWQRNDPVKQVRQLEQVEQETKQETVRRQELQLELLSLTTPAEIDALAINRLHMVQPDDHVVLHRFVPAPPPPASVVALR